MPSSSNLRRTYKSLERKFKNMIDSDPILQAMLKGELAWGDLARNEPIVSKKSPDYKPVKFGYSPLEGYVVPDLLLRKDIWTKFPVVLNKINSRDGTERYEIKWHQKNLKEYRERAESFDEWSDFTNWTETRLIHSLEAHPHKYIIEVPEKTDQIAIIAMVHNENAPRRSPTRKNSNNYSGPVLRKLNDIKEHFPVVWHSVDGRAGKSTYALELFGKKVKELSAVAKRDLTIEIKADLMRALKASKAWNVLPAVGKEVCRLEIV